MAAKGENGTEEHLNQERGNRRGVCSCDQGRAIVTVDGRKS